MKMKGSLIQAFLVCKRQAWLLAHQFLGEQDNENLAIGRFIAEEAYTRFKKDITIEEGKIDAVKSEKGETILIEIKKSSKRLKSAEFQLLLYMRATGVKRGEIRIPKEKRVIKVELTEEKLSKLRIIEMEAEKTVNLPLPPKPKKTKACARCSFEYFCWS